MYTCINKNGEYEGKFRAVNKNFGFVEVELEDSDTVSIYVPIEESRFSLTSDTVLVKITKEETGDKSAEGKIIKILDRKTDEIVGIFRRADKYGFVEPINKKIGFDIHIDKQYMKNIVNDTIVVAKLLVTKKDQKNPEGMILDTIGHKNDPNAQILSIVKDYNIRTNFPPEVLAEADKVAVEISTEEIQKRKDLRHLTTVTIDGEDAKDLDDAISLEILDGGKKRLYVSIADVSHYVKEDSFIDKEARLRGNSVYLVDRVIPMIPHVLSNGMCSLNEKEDRLTMTCEILYDENNEVIDSTTYKSIINSNKRMSYNGVHAILNGLELNNGEDIKTYEPYKEYLSQMLKLSLALRKQREERGSIDFNLNESKIIVDENCRPIEIHEYERLESHKMIEDFMIAANVEVAKEYAFKEVPFLYRTHEECEREKMERLSFFVSNFGLSLPYKNKVHPKQIQQLLRSAEGKDYQYVVERVTLRSMKQAKYTSELIGHFALSLKYYTHFTSPIRRYSDLQIHRIMKEYLDNELDGKRINHYQKILPKVAEKISLCERTAIDCEREVDDLKKCEYMMDYVGNEYEGIISSITNFGFYVELDNTIEGLVPIRTLKDDFYCFDEMTMKLVGERTKRVFELGMRVKVRVEVVSVELRQIDFALVERL